LTYKSGFPILTSNESKFLSNHDPHRLDLDAIDVHTTCGAYADFQEHLTGVIKVGWSADLICLDRNIFALPPSEISQAQDLLTIFQGKIVYQAPFNG
jgi:predicted amidohydrolase YtcJ